MRACVHVCVGMCVHVCVCACVHACSPASDFCLLHCCGHIRCFSPILLWTHQMLLSYTAVDTSDASLLHCCGHIRYFSPALLWTHQMLLSCTAVDTSDASLLHCCGHIRCFSPALLWTHQMLFLLHCYCKCRGGGRGDVLTQNNTLRSVLAETYHWAHLGVHVEAVNDLAACSPSVEKLDDRQDSCL